MLIILQLSCQTFYSSIIFLTLDTSHPVSSLTLSIACSMSSHSTSRFSGRSTFSPSVSYTIPTTQNFFISLSFFLYYCKTRAKLFFLFTGVSAKGETAQPNKSNQNKNHPAVHNSNVFLYYCKSRARPELKLRKVPEVFQCTPSLSYITYQQGQPFLRGWLFSAPRQRHT